MKTYHDIQGDGGSGVVQQVEALHASIGRALAGVRHRLAVGSGKGGVGKSTITFALARAFRARGLDVAVLDADFNGPCQARMAGLEGRPWIPGPEGLEIPRRRDGLGVVSFGSVLGAGSPLELESVARGDEHTWRATREFALLAQLLAGVRWGELDVLLFDLPPGAERTVQYADFLGADTDFVLVTIPSEVARGVVARSVAAVQGTGSALLRVVENMAGYACPGCDEIRPLFPRSDGAELGVPRLGSVPFDPRLAALCDEGFDGDVSSPALDAVDAAASRILDLLDADSTSAHDEPDA